MAATTIFFLLGSFTMTVQVKEAAADPLIQLDGKTISITGTICSCQEKKDHYLLEVKPKKASPLLITIYCKPSAEISQTLAVGMAFSLPSPCQNHLLGVIPAALIIDCIYWDAAST